MAKSLGEVNYEYLIEFFGSVEGRENFFTSDDGEDVLVFPAGTRAADSAERRKGPVGSISAQAGREKTLRRGRFGASSRGGRGLIARLLRGISALAPFLARWERGGD
ncbi:MAG: hypothetical protein LBD95_05345 [Clostridiales Family XIII bacterium]|jgi:hypothetical protein|nr:hypothetical protein [Clostridiales Family XIII bacterium]